MFRVFTIGGLVAIGANCAGGQTTPGNRRPTAGCPNTSVRLAADFWVLSGGIARFCTMTTASSRGAATLGKIRVAITISARAGACRRR
jgi:hypothetical protein